MSNPGIFKAPATIVDGSYLYRWVNGDTDVDDPEVAIMGDGSMVLRGAIRASGYGVYDVTHPRWGDGGADPTGTRDSSTAFAAAAAAMTSGGKLVVPAGSYTVSAATSLLANTLVWLEPGVTITQTAASTNIFRATSKDNVWVVGYGAVLYGEGTYSNTWTGVSGHEDRGVQFLGCTRSGIVGVSFKNFGACAIAIIGGSKVKVVCPTIEGTHSYSTAISSNDNFQVGIFLKHDTTYGNLDDCGVLMPDISGTTQGIVIEGNASFSADALGVNIVAPVIHDIPGQHGLYLQSGKVNVISPVIDNVALDGIKIQSGSSNFDIKSLTVSDFSVSNAGGHGVLLQTDGTGWVSGVRVSGVCHDVQRGIGINARVRDVQADIVVNDATQHGAILDGDELHDIDLRIRAKRSARYGVVVQATNSDGIRIWPVVRESNTSQGAFSGIDINSASLSVELYDPEATDADTNQVNGLFVEAGTVKVRGSATFTGASAYGARANVALLEWPSETTLGGSTAALLNVGNFVSTQPVTVTGQTTSASDITLWQRALSDESAYSITAIVVGKLAASGERRVHTTNVCAYRNGGNATVQGTADTIADTTSASFNGAIAWDVSGNNVRLRVNSGASETYDWVARVTVVELAD